MAIKRDTLWVRLVGILVIGLLIPATLMPGLSQFGTVDYQIQLAVSVIVTALLWEGNLYIILKLQKLLPWQYQTLKRLFVQIALSGVYSNLIVGGAIYTVSFVLELVPFQWNMMIYHLVNATILGIMVEALYEGSYFLSEWKKALSKAERLEKESTIAKYESLKNQVNPHFLFNSLNTLANMVMDEENDEALEFIQKLSKVYRYLLKSREDELESLRTEIEVVEEYVYLLKNRFGEAFQFQVNIEGFEDSVLPPLTLQMLVENCVKHNVVSQQKPLVVYVFVLDGFIHVKNDLNLKKVPVKESTKAGLDNIKKRYKLLTNKDVIVKTDHEIFEVKLPLIWLNPNDSLEYKFKYSNE